MIERTYFQILKITNGQGDDYTTICLLHYPCIKEHCKIIYLSIYSLIYLFIYSFIYLFIYLFACLYIYLFIYLFNYLLFIYLFIIYLKVDEHQIPKVMYKIGMYKVTIYTC